MKVIKQISVTVCMIYNFVVAKLQIYYFYIYFFGLILFMPGRKTRGSFASSAWLVTSILARSSQAGSQAKQTNHISGQQRSRPHNRATPSHLES